MSDSRKAKAPHVPRGMGAGDLEKTPNGIAQKCMTPDD